MFTTILIANRGEIACRIIKTARAMGIHTVAIYSDADRNSQHVMQADSAYYIGPSPAKESYLNIEKIIQIAKKSDAQAIHPGYGFLSENPIFAKACKKAGIVFIGPSVSAMEAMASKQLAKQLLEKTQVPLTPGYHGQDQSESTLLSQAKAIGFPILLKAASGGGGKGMRAVHQEVEFSEALAGAKRESLASFGDETMIIEKLVQNPRHVEVQIMADNHGQVVHLFERDCSIQRRHQKIIEEAPAPHLSAKLRNQLAKSACEVALAISYSGAGTIEFLVDEHENFYFMEMNTRLQVEHPVTEMITHLDLVAWQLKIAANEPLPLPQEQIHQQGHAIECRIYAEDPYQDFIPSIGEVDYLLEPSAVNIRIDTGIRQGSSITKYYDPMIAKLIAWGKDRDEALSNIQYALKHYFIGGVKTNIPFLGAICQNPRFQKGQLGTAFLSEESLVLESPDEVQALLMAISYDYLKVQQQINDPLFLDCFAWQVPGFNHWTQSYYHNDEVLKALIKPKDKNNFSLQLEGLSFEIYANLRADKLSIEYDDKSYCAWIKDAINHLIVFSDKGSIRVTRFDWKNLKVQSAATKGQLTAPMPSTVVAVLKNVGDSIKAGDKLIVLEAMKMEHTIHAPNDGILKEVFYAVGAQVNEGAELLALSENG